MVYHRIIFRVKKENKVVLTLKVSQPQDNH